METVKTLHVLAIRSSLAAEARGVCGKLLRELVVLKNHVPEDVGHRNFGGRHEIEIIELDIVHLGLLVRKLACTETGSRINHYRRLHLHIAVLGVLLQEEIDEGSLKLRALALVDRETSPSELDSERKIYDIVFLSEFPVRKSVLRELDLRAAHLNDLIILRALARLDLVVRDIREKDKIVEELLIVLVGLGQKFSGLLLEESHFLLDFLSLIFAAFLHQFTDFAGLYFLLGEKAVALSLELAAVLIESQNFFHDGPRIEILDSQLLDNELWIVAKHLKCKHISLLFNEKGWHIKLKCRPVFLPPPAY